MRSTTRSVASATFVALALTLLSLPLGASPSGASEVDDFLSRINALRSSIGIGPLTVDGELSGSSQGWAQHMADTGVLAHDSGLTSAVSAPWTKIGENVGYGPTTDSIWNAFVSSPAHYANLVDPAFTHVGVGVVTRNGLQWTTHRFMRLEPSRPTPPPTPAPEPPPVTAPPATAPPATNPPATTPPTTRAPSTPATTAPSSTGSGNPSTGDPNGSSNGGTDGSSGSKGKSAPAEPGRVAAVLDALYRLDS